MRQALKHRPAAHANSNKASGANGAHEVRQRLWNAGRDLKVNYAHNCVLPIVLFDGKALLRVRGEACGDGRHGVI
eukprot:scaffold8796_cov32-Tisochrysis_lutea.AAC.2